MSGDQTTHQQRHLANADEVRIYSLGVTILSFGSCITQDLTNNLIVFIPNLLPHIRGLGRAYGWLGVCVCVDENFWNEITSDLLFGTVVELILVWSSIQVKLKSQSYG